MALKLQKFMNRRVLHKVSKSFNTDGPQLREEIGESEVNNQETAVLALSDKTRYVSITLLTQHYAHFFLERSRNLRRYRMLCSH